MPKTMVDQTFGPDGNEIVELRRVYEVPDTKTEKALAWLTANDPEAITTVGQAKTFIVAHHKILTAMLKALQRGVLDEDDDGTI